MPRKTNIQPFDPEIEKTERRIRREKRLAEKRIKSDKGHHSNSEAESVRVIQGRLVDSHLIMERIGNNNGNGENEGNQNGENMDNNRHGRSIKQLTASSHYDPFLNEPGNGITFEVKNTLLSKLPSFHGLTGEDPLKHVTKVQVVCSRLAGGIDFKEVMRQIFYFTLEAKAKEWYLSLVARKSNALRTWEGIYQVFVEKYAPTSKVAIMRKEIFAAKQQYDEGFAEFWDRFQDLIARCPNHQILEEHLIQYFHHGLQPKDRVMLDTAAGGDVEDLTPENAWSLIDKIAAKHQQFESRSEKAICVTNQRLGAEGIAAELAALRADLADIRLQQMVKDEKSLAMVTMTCERCSSPMHTTENCTVEYENISAMFQARQGQSQKVWNPQSNTYNEGWRSHPNFSWRNNSGNSQSEATVQKPAYMNQTSSSKSLVPSDYANKEMMQFMSQLSSDLKGAFQDSTKEMNKKIEDVQQQMELKYNNLSSFVTQLANGISGNQAQTGDTLPSNTVINPKQLNAISLRSGRVVSFEETKKKEVLSNEEDDSKEDLTVDNEAVEIDRNSIFTAAESESGKEKELLQKEIIRVQGCGMKPQEEVEETKKMRKLGSCLKKNYTCLFLKHTWTCKGNLQLLQKKRTRNCMNCLAS